MFRFAGSSPALPADARRIFCDGSADATFRDGVDLELSHWIPNRTPARYKADTSTAICARFVAEPPPGEWGAAINNHVDTDGVLSAFTLTHPELGLPHRETLAQAASMGDFMGWGDDAAQRLYQGLGVFKARLLREEVEPQQIYERCFDRVGELLEGAALDDEAAAGVAALQRSLARIESGEIRRTRPHERLALYATRDRLPEADVDRALRIPAFDAILSSESLLLPQARARRDAQRLQLVSSRVDAGWFHDVWYPGYVWAETPESWRPRGLVVDSSNAHRVELRAWRAAAAALQRRERGPGRWEHAGRLTPFETLRGRGYPVVLALMHRGRPAPSGLAPETVSELLLEAGVAE